MHCMSGTTWLQLIMSDSGGLSNLGKEKPRIATGLLSMCFSGLHYQRDQPIPVLKPNKLDFSLTISLTIDNICRCASGLPPTWYEIARVKKLRK